MTCNDIISISPLHNSEDESLNGAEGMQPELDGSVEAEDSKLLEYLSTMQQGMVVWSAEGRCEFFNQRMVEMNELSDGQIALGFERISLLQKNPESGTKDSISMEELEKRFARGQPFVFDRRTNSNRTIVAAVQPRSNGGHVVTFADVTAQRANEFELDEAKKIAEIAREQAQTALVLEKRRKHQSKLLGELGEWLQSCKSLKELYKVIARFMETLFNSSTGELFIYSNSRDVLDSACVWNQDTSCRHIHADDCWALRRGRIFKHGFGMVDFECGHVDHNSADEDQISNLGRYVCLPIVAHGDTVGLLHIDFRNYKNADSKTQAADEETVSFALQCSEQISLAIANVRLRDELRDQSTRDPLTGLYNRRYFMESCRTAFQDAQRNDGSVGVISIDADNFKYFNDNHGHDAGDMVLRAISGILQKECDKIGTPCRYGGEEFTIVLPKFNVEESCEFAENIREQAHELAIRYGGSVLPKVSISVGVATYPQSGTNPQDVLTSADSALYNAKDAGKNVVMTD